jgi:hypothetical protein
VSGDAFVVTGRLSAVDLALFAFAFALSCFAMWHVLHIDCHEFAVRL